MSESPRTIEGIFRDLQERAKELNCLYTIEEFASNPALSLDDVVWGAISAIPSGWQHPHICHARIELNGSVYQSPGFRETPWVQTAPIRVQGEKIGQLEVCYTEAMPVAAEGPFLKEERKLIDTIAERLGSCITHRQLVDAMQEWRSARREVSQRTVHDWSVILDLLRRTDQSLLMRVTRKMINHLCWSGVKEADGLLRHFGSQNREADALDENAPRKRNDLLSNQALVDEAFRIAALHLSDEEIVTCIHSWIKQDRASFLVKTVDNYHTTLAQVADAIGRYLHSTHGEVELSPSMQKGLRVSLVRRFLSSQFEFLNIAKKFVDIPDFHDLMQRSIYPADGHGKIGGKASGLVLAGLVAKSHRKDYPILAELKTPRAWYVTSDGVYDFVYNNHLEDVLTHKYKDIDEIRSEYHDIVQVFKHSHFSPDIMKGLAIALDEFGERPLIVRSSSLLEDRFGAAFSGKYKSLFLANQGRKQDRLNDLTDAIAEVYASVFGPDPIEYRAERNLLDFQEGMAILIQEVIGTRVGDYFLPAFAGVAFSHNEFRWSPRIKREDGLVRLVPGLGTRAVDRLGDDYPVLVSPGQPGLRANASPDEIVQYAPKHMDVINLKTNCFETLRVSDFLKRCGDHLPGIEQLVSVFDHGHLRPPMLGGIDFSTDDLVITFEGLLTRTPFIKQVHALLGLLQRELQTPVDIEFANDGKDLYLLQCRAQNPTRNATPSPIPRDIPPEQVIFTAKRYVSNGLVPDLTHLVYVDPDGYADLSSLEELNAVARAVGRLNKLLPKHKFALLGPGRWGSRGDIKLGVKVTYSDINNTALLVEIARRRGDYTPDLSFGTHFFQDLVEAAIRYLPLYPDDEGVIFNELFLTRAPNIFTQLAPEFAGLERAIRVIDVPAATEGSVLRVLTNADLEEAVAFLASPSPSAEIAPTAASTGDVRHEQFWLWRMRMAERIAGQLDEQRFGVQALYVFGSTENGTAGPASDIDLLVHHRGTAEQRQNLTQWFEGWSLCLAEMNYLRTGYRTDGLLDVHIITDEDIAAHSSWAAKINAVTDAARPLALGAAFAGDGADGNGRVPPAPAAASAGAPAARDLRAAYGDATE